jgi:ABC-type glycerol-3-phosphate transport system substrate-binding protein
MVYSPIKMILVLLFLVLCWRTVAQDNIPIILSVQFSEGMEFLDGGTTFSDFEASHPNVEVNVIYKPWHPDDYVPHDVNDITPYLDKVDNFTLQADVLMMNVGEGMNQLWLEATRAGYVLDLAPLFNASPTADASVYYPTVWQASQWDGGLWILPTSTTITAIVYDADAFDAAGLAYPDASWEADDFANAADVLARRDAAGNVTTPGFWGINGRDGALVYRFLEQPLYDSTQFPNVPRFVRPDTLAVANQWLPFLASGAMFNFQHDYGEDFSLDRVPLTTDWLSIAYLNDLEFAPLPGDGTLVNINGFVVSSRTQYPQLAYELAAHLAADRQVANATSFSWGGMTLARPAYPDVVAIEHAPYSLAVPNEEARLLIDSALRSGIPASELMYYPYFQNALWQAAENELDIETALRDAEILAKDNLTLAENRRNEIAGIVPTPVPEIALAPGEIELHFFHQEGDTIQWQLFAEEFAANDPEVARIVMNGSAYRFDYTQEGTDCFYGSSGFFQVAQDYILDIAPLLAADSEFVAEDWLTGVFAGVQQDESIYALPIDIRPLALWYESSQLEAHNLLPPHTMSELLNTLEVLNNEDDPPLASYQLGRTLLMLIATYGAVPVNYQTNPIQIDFTSENNVNAMQQVLDLARNGVIKYGSIVDFSSAGFPESEPLLIDFVADSDFRNAAYLPVVFPAGRQYTPVSYELMAGYISRFSQYPEACYRLLRNLSSRPDLLSGIPVQRSVASLSEHVGFYDDFNQQLNTPNQVIISQTSQHEYFTSYWLFRAFDRYVLEDADLVTELSIAEQFTNDYLLCVEVGEIPNDCARQIDPSVGS